MVNPIFIPPISGDIEDGLLFGLLHLCRIMPNLLNDFPFWRVHFGVLEQLRWLEGSWSWGGSLSLPSCHSPKWLAWRTHWFYMGFTMFYYVYLFHKPISCGSHEKCGQWNLGVVSASTWACVKLGRRNIQWVYLRLFSELYHRLLYHNQTTT